MEGSWTRCFKKDYAYRDHDTLLTYPGFNETFKIHTDASAFQLGAVISQKGNLSLSTVEKLMMTNNGTQ